MRLSRVPRGSFPELQLQQCQAHLSRPCSTETQARASNSQLPASEPRALRPEEAGGWYSGAEQACDQHPGAHPFTPLAGIRRGLQNTALFAWSIHRHVLLKTIPVGDPVRCCASHDPTRQVLSSFYREGDQDREQASHTPGAEPHAESAHFQSSWGCCAEALFAGAVSRRGTATPGLGLGVRQSVCRVGVPLGPEGGLTRPLPL